MPKRICVKCGKRSAYVKHSAMIKGKRCFNIPHRRKIVVCLDCGNESCLFEVSDIYWGKIMNFFKVIVSPNLTLGDIAEIRKKKNV